MTVEQARELLEELENEVQSLVEKFEEETNMEVHDIEIQRFDITTYIDDRWKSMINQIHITTQL